MLSRFYLIPERYGQTDGQTDGQIGYINIARVSMLTRDKNVLGVDNLSVTRSILQRRPIHRTLTSSSSTVRHHAGRIVLSWTDVIAGVSPMSCQVM